MSFIGRTLAQLTRPSNEWGTWLGRGAHFFAAANLGWLALILADVGARGGALGSASELFYLAALGASSTALGALCLAPLYALRHWTRHWPVTADVLAVVPLAVTVVWREVQFLTAGDAISASAHLAWVKAALTLLLVTFLLGAWVWHRALVERAQRARTTLALWLLGGITLVGCAYAISYELDAYFSFAAFLMPPTWLLAGSLSDAALARVPLGLRRGLAGGSGLIAGIGILGLLGGPIDADPSVVERSRLASVLQVRLGLGRLDVGSISIDLSGRHACQLTAPRPWSPLAVQAQHRRHAIVISVDALRKDALGQHIQGVEVMPNLSQFRARSQVFERAVTTYPATLFGLGGALTGLYPSEILLAPKPPKNVFTMTEGQFTTRLIALPDDPWFHMPAIEQLLTTDARVGYVRGDERRTRAFIEALTQARSSGARTLGWIHYLDPHAPYEERSPALFGHTPAGRYLGEVHEVDRLLGNLLRYLETDGWLEDSLVIVLSDHGQALGERGYLGHHVYLNGWIADIPLVMYVPELPPHVAMDVVAPIDVAATLLHWAEAKPENPLSGESLFDVLQKPDSERTRVAEAFPVRGRALFDLAATPLQGFQDVQARLDRVRQTAANYQPRVSIVNQRYRFIANRETKLSSLFDRERDPSELHDISLNAPDVEAALTRQLGAWHEALSERISCRIASSSDG